MATSQYIKMLLLIYGIRVSASLIFICIKPSTLFELSSHPNKACSKICPTLAEINSPNYKNADLDNF